MSNLSIPFNLDLLVLNDQLLLGVKPVRTLDVFQGATKEFHEDGLFSVSIFGRIGEERRMRRISYIDIKLPILHPLVYKILGELKRLNLEIMEGKAYAKWDPQLKDFVKSDQLEGDTGYQFFMQHWQDIAFEERASDERTTKIKLIEKYKSKALNSKIVVIPAGLRDYEIQGDGRESENEINDLYRKLLTISRNIPPNALKHDMQQFDNTRIKLQGAFNELYDLFKRYTEGKKKLLMGKWARRGIHNGTRNVITTTNIRATELGSAANVQYNDTVVGLFQYMKAALPVVKYQLKNGILSNIFTGPQAPAFLVNKETLKKEAVRLKPEHYDTWMTTEGLDGVINRFGEPQMRQRVMEIEGYYMALIYKDSRVFRVFQDIDELPEGWSRDNVKPITFIELMYLSVYKNSRRYPALFTRYPVLGFGSIYPSTVFLRTTMQVQALTPLNDDWSVDPDAPVAWQFPTESETFDTVSPSPARLAGLGADFDGDTGTFTILYTEEAIAETDRFFNDRNFYVGSDGKIAASVAVDTVNYLLQNMTGDPEPTLGVEGVHNVSQHFTIHGQYYNLEVIKEGIKDQKTERFKCEDLAWMLNRQMPDNNNEIRTGLQQGTLELKDVEKLKQADLSEPILVHNHEYWGLTMIDGYHRLKRAIADESEEIVGYRVSDELFEKARVK